ncbi:MULTISPECIES: hypothetical protein [unclassified Methanoregula]|uniref:hypothetical protein n=1 Tax=unclassified Methanoregula TaxID=2649730 RepID=UPI0009D5D1E9|nr:MULTISPECIES: hypothetical protein [unclassified Methanoregula]OPX65335.1 MAG: hypothetical protein A4E33_00368 [Methanoregula sp. PtaB.Bin085]OPY32244.1 MAG: hypothetical protein A4E34_02618 [Methanoregula sp. PtaU1.Bin006]
MKLFKRIPIWVPPLSALGILYLYSILAGVPVFPCKTIVMLSLLAAFVAMAVITPVPLLEKFKGGFPVIPLFLTFIIALGLLGYFILGGSRETRAGGLMPPFGYRFPISGLAADTLVSLTGFANIMYQSPVYDVMIWAGLFIEIGVVSGIMYLVSAHQPPDS